MIHIDGHSLTIEQVVKVARTMEQVSLSGEAIKQIDDSHNRLLRILESGKAVYGINTGFGIFADRRIDQADSSRLSRNLIISHAVGCGDPLSKEIVRAAMLIRANTLAKGFSGVRLEVVQTLLEMLNRDVTPVIPSQGSLGSSGDLCQLSHLALVLTTDTEDKEEESGVAWYKDTWMSGKQAMLSAGIDRVILGPKEGLALNNGATFCASIGALTIYEAEQLLNIAEISLALSLEALEGCRSAFDPRLHIARGHPGQIDVAKKVLDLVEGSTLADRSGRVQDAYSLRCAPQVQGISRETIAFARQIITREINAATDNPLIFENGDAVSGGNFHGEPIGMAMDFVGIAMSEVAAISERRTFRMTDGKLNGGLPPMLVDSTEAAGLNSGLMMPQYTAASLVLENQALASPDSVRSLPTSGEQEDHNANATTAARHALQIVHNTRRVLAIELFTASRAITLRLKQYPDAVLGRMTNVVFDRIMQVAPYKNKDGYWNSDIEKIDQDITGICLDENL